MARARNIKPGFYKNEDLAECSVWARFLFPGLWMLADREGRLEDRPKRIKGELLPFDSIEVEPLLQELAARGFILRYEARGLKLIAITAFTKHQNPHHREPPSDLPPPESPGLAPDGTAPKPGAHAPCDAVEAQGQPRASPGLPPPKSDLARGSSRADSLIPDSGFPIPDPGSPIPETGARAQPPVQAAPPPTRTGAACALLRGLGVNVTPADPRLLGWLGLGATDEQLREAVDRARIHKPPPDRIPAAYLDPIVREVIAGPPQRANGHAEPAWWGSESATIAKGEQIGVRARPGEEMHAYRQRIREALAKQVAA